MKAEGLQILVTEREGVCRWCGCTDVDGCAEGCGWANARHTLCTACVNLDRDMRSVRGRRQVADLYRVGEDEDAIATARRRRG
jgi:hypothetical protein